MSLQKNISQKKNTHDKDDSVESYGVCSRENAFSEQRKFILHLRVHPSKMRKLSHKNDSEKSKNDTSLIYMNETYNDLMRYNPEISTIPSAYEETLTDSHPLQLIDDVIDKTNGDDNKPESERSLAPSIVNDTTFNSSVCVKCQNETIETASTVQDNHTDQQTYQHCWWCTYHFDHDAFSVPIGIAANKQYNTTGCFCTPECTAAYIFDNKCGVCDTWKQYEMLHRMVNKMHNGTEIRIKLAPPRETLQRYGGPYNIETYRDILQDYRKHVRISMPPINPVHKLIEEVAVDYTQNQHKFLPIDTSRVKKAENELCLKRKKKQASENSLEAFMQLRMRNKT